MNDIIYDGKFKYNEAIASTYDSDREKEQHWVLENGYIENFLSTINNSKILDIPVGTGRFLKYYHSNEIIGIDISQDMLNQSEQIVSTLEHNKIKLQIGDAANLDFIESYFDYTVCFRLLHLIPPTLRVTILKELKRVTRKQIIIQVYEDINLSLVQRIIRKVKSSLTKKYRDESIKPWEHITSYPLKGEHFLQLISSLHINIDDEVELCSYHGLAVKVYVLSK